MKLKKMSLGGKPSYFFYLKTPKTEPPVWISFFDTRKRYYICGHLYFLNKYFNSSFRSKGFKSKNTAIKTLKTLSITFFNLNEKDKKVLCLIDIKKKEYPRRSIKEFDKSLKHSWNKRIISKKKRKTK